MYGLVLNAGVEYLLIYILFSMIYVRLFGCLLIEELRIICNRAKCCMLVSVVRLKLVVWEDKIQSLKRVTITYHITVLLRLTRACYGCYSIPVFYFNPFD